MRYRITYFTLLILLIVNIGYSAAITVGFDTATSSGTETNSPAVLTVKLTSSSTGNDTTLTSDVIINYSEGTGSTAKNFPTNYYDFTLSPASLTIPAGVDSANIEIAIQDDSRDESNETIVCELSVPFGLDPGTTSHTYTINDNESAPTVTFATATSTGTEGTLVQLTVNLNQDAGLTVTVPWSFQSGSSTAVSADLTPTSGSLSFVEGESSHTIDFTPVDDTIDELEETVYIQFSAPTNASFGAITGHQVTIADADDSPEIAFSATTSTQNESAGSVTLYIELNTPSGLETSVNYSISGTATGGGIDHNLGSGTATIAAGDGSTTLTFNIINDALDEDNETIILSLSSPNNSTVGGNDTHTITITDNDTEPFIYFDNPTGDGGEGSTPVNIAVSLSTVSGRDVSVNYSVNGGTATGSGTDYTFTDGTLTFSAGQTSKNISLIVVNDDIDEPDETVIILLSDPPTNATLGTNDGFTYTINDNDTEPTIGFTVASSTKAESAGTVTVQITLTAQSGNDISVDYFISGGTATGSGTDYSITEGTATITSGNLTSTFNVTIIDDELDENSETIIIGLQNEVNVTLGGNDSHTMSITDNDDSPTVAFTSASSSGSEAANPAQLTVNLSRSSGLAVSVGYSVTGGTTATGSGTDYTLANGTLNYSVGDSTETIDITIVNDALDENTEYIEVTLASPSNATLGGTTTHTYSLTDDDPKPSVGFTTTAASGAESASPTITAQLSAVSGLDITVDYAVTGGTATGSATDYTFQDDTFTITAGDQTATAEITIVDDDSDEDNETIIIQLSNPSSTTALNTNAQTITYTILDNDDAPNISFSLGASSQNENAGSVSLTVSLSAASGRDVSFDYAVTGGTATGSGTDYTFTAGSKTITAGQTTTTIPITITDDTIDENSETVIITLSNATNGAITGNITHTLTITDNDATPTISFNQLSKSSPESTTNPTIGLTITAASGLDISVDYTVTDGTAIGGGVDFTLDAGTISISAGNTTASISPAIIDDDSDEDDETFTVTLSSGSESNVSLPAAGNRTHTFTITDNDDPPADFTVGTITTVGGQVMPRYWNATNTAFTVRVPVANNADLEGGSIQVIAKNSTSSYGSLGTSKTILNGELGDSATITISEAQFIAHAAYGEAKVITISANISDQYGNVTQGTASSTTLTIDTTDPTAFQVSTLTVVGDPVISGYWNSYNTSLNAIVPIENDPTLIAGTIVLQGQVGGTSGDWTSLGSQQPIGAGQVNTNITISPTRVQLEAIASFDNTGARLYISATITDRAGNSTQATSSSTQIIIDEDSPSVTSVASNASSIETVYFNAGDQIQIHIVTDEPIVKSVGGTPLINLNSGTSVNASYSSGQGTTTQVFTYTVAADQNTVDLDYTSVNALSLGGATLKDSAGNDLTLTLASPSDVGSLGGDYDLVIDTQRPEGYISFDNNPVNAETNTNLTVDFSESMATASAYILFAGGSTIETTSLVQGGELTWGLFVDVPPGNDGYATITITGEDLAGNSITNALTFGRDILRIDNTQPTFTLLSPVTGEYVNHSLVGYRLSETSFSGFVRWTRISGTSDPNSPHNSSLTASELEGLNTFSDYTLTNDPNNLVSGTTYSMTWLATDSAGNISDNFISTPVYYDTTAPTGILTYSHYYASEDTVVTITATFNERILLTTPKISVNFQGTGGDVSNINMAMGADSTIWTYDVLTPPGVGNNGFANVGITATDLAQNSLRVSDLQNTDTLFVDNTVPTATITYSDSLVKEGDNVIVTVEFSEEMIGPPQIGIIYAGGSELDTTNLLSVSSTVWEKQITIPGGNDGAATVSIIANDIAGNLLANANTSNRSLLRVDNIIPYFISMTPDTGSYVNHTQIGYFIEENLDRLFSGRITWNPGNIFADLVGTELDGGSHLPTILTNNPTLDDGETYTISFFGQDSVGNDTTINVPNITYDITAPSCSLAYSQYYANGGDDLTITAFFDERTLQPTIDIDYFGVGSDLIDQGMTTVGDDSTEWTYYIADIPAETNQNGVVNVTISATDFANNALQMSNISNTDTLIIDNSLPLLTLSYENLTQPNLINLGKAGDSIRVTAAFNDSITIPPTLDVQYADSTYDSMEGIPYISNSNGDSTWIFGFTIASGDSNSGIVTVSVNAQDKTGNPLTNANTTNRTLLRVDNIPPYFTSMIPDTGGYVNHTQLGYTIEETFSNRLESAIITWSPLPSGIPINSTLVGEELDVSVHELATLTNNPQLVDSTLYRMSYFGRDTAGNTSTTIVDSVTYDITSPLVNLAYSKYFVREADTVRITAEFNERVLPTPLISIDYTSDLDIEIVDSTMTIGVNSTVWYYDAVIPLGANFSGIASVIITANDLAGNQLPSENISNSDTLIVDNSPPSVTFTYENITQSNLINLGKFEDNIRITASFTDVMVDPIINVQYADSTDDSIENLTDNGSAASDSIWYFDITLPENSMNSGIITLSTNSRDRARNQVSTFTYTNIFEIDNNPPTDFITGIVEPVGSNTVTGWLNGITNSVEIDVPIASNDPSLLFGGDVSVEMFIKNRSVDWTTIGSPDSILNAGNFTISRTATTLLDSLSILAIGDTLLIRASINDKVGNITEGDTSTSILVYDPDPPVFDDTQIGIPPDTTILISSDSINSNWTDLYYETNPQLESGISYYEFAMDSSTTIDTSGFVNWLYRGSSTQIDTIFPLSHETLYRTYVRCIDIAGNISTGNMIEPLFFRQNMAPLITDIDTLIWFEDSTFVDTLEILDADYATLLEDVVIINVTTTRLFGDDAASSMNFDSLSGAINWSPTQVDTGTYRIDITATDENNLSDTFEWIFVVEPVNDSPVLNISAPDSFITFAEDKLAADSILVNLSQYASDVDDSVKFLSWQVVILQDTSTYPGFPMGQVIIGPGTSNSQRNYLRNKYTYVQPMFAKLADIKQLTRMNAIEEYVDSLHVDLFVRGDSTWAFIYADTNYYTDTNREIIVYSTDVEGLSDIDTIRISVTPENDPPFWSIIGDQIINENDSLKIDLTEFITDVDDSLLTFKITGLTNSDKMTIPITQFSSTTHGDSLFFIPEKLWSDTARIQVIAYDRDYPNQPYKSDTTEFTIDVLFVPRPAISMWVVQNNAFSNFYKIFITDSARKTTSLVLKVQSDNVALDTVGAYTYVGNHSFVGAGTYAFNVVATGIVGETDTTSSVGLTVARMNKTWSGKSSDGVFGLQGKPGSVGYDQSFMVLDSSMFDPSFYDRASYLIGNEAMSFEDPVLISFKTEAKDIAIYRRDIGISWQELPSMAADGGVVSAYSDRMGYYRLGPKTIFVPNETDLGNNYPNPFNPYTNIEFDIGFMDGPRQKANISVFNIRGQQIATLYNNYIGIGRHTIRWDSKDDRGTNVASGIYFVRLSTSSGINKTHKVLLVR